MADDAMPEIPIDAAGRIVREIVRKLGPDTRVMPIGGTAMGLLQARVSGTTKDVDLVIVLADPAGAKIPAYAEIVRIAQRLVDDPAKVVKREDQTSVMVPYRSEIGTVKLELVCGRGASGGYFVKRRVLEGLVAHATLVDGVYRLPLQGLAFLKAWAATDKAKLVAAGKDARGYHANRERAFRREVADILDILRRRGTGPEMTSLGAMLALAGKEREKAIRAVMRDAGWPT